MPDASTMPLVKTPSADFAYQGAVVCAGKTHRVWLFRVIPDAEAPYLVLSVENAATFAFVPGEKLITGMELVRAGCDAMLAGKVLELLDRFLQPLSSPQVGIENRPHEGT